MGNRNKKNTRKLDFKTLRTVKARFTLLGTSLAAESRKLGFNHNLGRKSLIGETQGELSLKRKEWLIRLSKGLPIETKEPEPETTTGDTACHPDN